jgi:hypothetical protein
MARHTNWMMRTLRMTLAVASFLWLAGCGLSSSIDRLTATIDTRTAEAIHTLDNAISALSSESSDWRTVITNLEKDISKDVQSTLRTEIQDLTRVAVLSAGSEFRCNAEYMRLRVRQSLIQIRNSLVSDLNSLLGKSVKFPLPLIPESPLEPFICSAVPSAVDMTLDPERRSKIDIFGFDLRTRPITVGYRSHGSYVSTKRLTVREYVAVLKARPSVTDRARAIKTNDFEIISPLNPIIQDISSSLSIISDFHAVLDLTEGGADLPPNAEEIVLSWNNRIQSSIPIQIHEKTLDCTTSEKLVTPGTDTYNPPAVTSSQYGSDVPDKDFNGNGPCVKLSMNVWIDAERKHLTASYTLHFWECPDDFGLIHEDYTEAIGTRTILLFTAADDEQIIGFDCSPSAFDQYIDTDMNTDMRNLSAPSPIDKLEYTGDTDGDESGTKSGVKITFRNFHVRLQKCTYK